MRTIQQDSHSDGIIKVKKNGGEKRPVIRDVTRLKGFVKLTNKDFSTSHLYSIILSICISTEIDKGNLFDIMATPIQRSYFHKKH